MDFFDFVQFFKASSTAALGFMMNLILVLNALLRT